MLIRVEAEGSCQQGEVPAVPTWALVELQGRVDYADKEVAEALRDVGMLSAPAGEVHCRALSCLYPFPSFLALPILTLPFKCNQCCDCG